MAWYVNFILGFLIGCWICTYVDPVRLGFKKIMGFLAKKAQSKPEPKTKEAK